MPRPPAPNRTDCGLPDRGIVFCAYNQTYKITPEVFDVWCRLLNAVPDSMLWLKTSNDIAGGNLQREAQLRGVPPTRLVMTPQVASVEQHLARLQCADLFLDTFPYNAHSTCRDALWMGLPVVTCAGETFPSRVAGSLLTAMDIPELIAGDLDGYYAIALALATDQPRRVAIHDRLIASRDRSPAFDSRRFTRNLEAAYARMWDELLAASAARQ
jgi:protein O-GlcNAc transferase